MSDDPEMSRWECAELKEEIEVLRKRSRITDALIKEMKISIDVFAHVSTVQSRWDQLMTQFSDEGSKTATYMLSVWGDEYQALKEREKTLAQMVLKYETWKR